MFKSLHVKHKFFKYLEYLHNQPLGKTPDKNVQCPLIHNELQWGKWMIKYVTLQ